MANKVVFVLDEKGVRELLKSSMAEEVVRKHAQDSLAGCPAGYAIGRRMTGERVAYSLYADTIEAVHDNLKNNTILRALK